MSKNVFKIYKIKMQEWAVSSVSLDTVSNILPNPAKEDIWPHTEAVMFAFVGVKCNHPST